MNPSDVLKYGHLTLLASIDGLTPEQMEMGDVCGVWSTREIMAHLASYEHLLVDVLSTFLGNKSTPTLIQMAQLGGGGFNDAQVAMRAGKSVAEVLDEYNTVQARTMAMVPQIAAETWSKAGTLPWYGMEYALDDYIVYTYYGHKREHSAQINVFKDLLKKP
jgi:hypothetical protein